MKRRKTPTQQNVSLVVSSGGNESSDRNPRRFNYSPWLFCLTILNVLLLFSCLFLLSYNAPARTDLDFDYYGVIIGVLSLLVTVLIGWNIYTAVDVVKTVSKLESKFSDLNKETEKALSAKDYDIRQRHHYSEGKAAISLMNVFMHIKKFAPPNAENVQNQVPIDYYIVYYGLVGAVNKEMSDGDDNTEAVLNVLVEHLGENHSFTLNPSLLSELLKLLYMLDSKKYKQVKIIENYLLGLTIVDWE